MKHNSQIANFVYKVCIFIFVLCLKIVVLVYVVYIYWLLIVNVKPQPKGLSLVAKARMDKLPRKHSSFVQILQNDLLGAIPGDWGSLVIARLAWNNGGTAQACSISLSWMWYWIKKKIVNAHKIVSFIIIDEIETQENKAEIKRFVH